MEGLFDYSLWGLFLASFLAQMLTLLFWWLLPETGLVA
jgi:hypothetical protein